MSLSSVQSAGSRLCDVSVENDNRPAYVEVSVEFEFQTSPVFIIHNILPARIPYGSVSSGSTLEDEEVSVDEFCLEGTSVSA